MIRGTVESELKSLVDEYPIVTILGARQAGKIMNLSRLINLAIYYLKILIKQLRLINSSEHLSNVDLNIDHGIVADTVEVHSYMGKQVTRLFLWHG